MHRRRSLVGLVLGVSAALTLAGAASPRTAATVVVTGTVLLDPATPVCKVGTPCSRPLAGLTLMFSRQGGDVVRARTNRRGRYRLLLSPGTYGVSALAGRGRGGRLAPRRISVSGAKSVRNFTYDAGIR